MQNVAIYFFYSEVQLVASIHLEYTQPLHIAVTPKKKEQKVTVEQMRKNTICLIVLGDKARVLLQVVGDLYTWKIFMAL